MFQQQKGGVQMWEEQLITIKMFYQFAFDTQVQLDEADFSEPHDPKRSLPTTTHNSPHHSDEDHFEREQDHEEQSECSFQENCQSAHANAIWNAANAYLQHSNYSLGCQGEVSVGLEEAILNNKLLRSRERSRLMGELRREGELCGLLTELLLIFSLPAFQELLFLVHNIWQRHYLPFRTRTPTSLLPRLSAFVGWAEDERKVESMRWGEEEADEVRRRAEEGLEGLARQLFYSKKLKVFADEGRAGEGRFLAFLQAVSKSLFLSAEGFYGEESWEGEMWEQEQGRLVRAFSQIQAQHDGLQGSKRRKLE